MEKGREEEERKGSRTAGGGGRAPSSSLIFFLPTSRPLRLSLLPPPSSSSSWTLLPPPPDQQEKQQWAIFNVDGYYKFLMNAIFSFEPRKSSYHGIRAHFGGLRDQYSALDEFERMKDALLALNLCILTQI